MADDNITQQLLDIVKSGFDETRREIGELKTEVGGLKTALATVQATMLTSDDIAEMQANVTAHETAIDILERTVDGKNKDGEGGLSKEVKTNTDFRVNFARTAAFIGMVGAVIGSALTWGFKLLSSFFQAKGG